MNANSVRTKEQQNESELSKKCIKSFSAEKDILKKCFFVSRTALIGFFSENYVILC